MCSMSVILQAPLAASEEPALARQLADAMLDHYGVSSAQSRPPSMPAAVAVVLATCGHHLSRVAASLRSGLVAATVSQLASASDMDGSSNGRSDRTATAWRRALAAAEATAAPGGLNVQPMRGGGAADVRPTFVSIPELDEGHDLGVGGAAKLCTNDEDGLVLGPGSPALKAPAPAAKTLSHAMTKAFLGSTLRCTGGGNAVRPQSPALHRSMASMTAESAPTPPPPIVGALATPRGGESEALARLDYDTSQTLTQFSDAEHRTSLAPYVLDVLEGVPPPPEEAAGGGEGTRRGTHRLSLRASGHAAAERSSLLLSPRDKSAVQRAHLPAMPFIALLAKQLVAVSLHIAADQNDRKESRVQGVIRCAEAAWCQVYRCVACSTRYLTKRARQAGSRAAHGFTTPHTHIPSSCS